MDLEWRNLFTRIELVGKPEKLTEDYHEDVHNIIHVNLSLKKKYDGVLQYSDSRH